MTDSNDLQIRLRAWMDETAPARQPAGLVDGAMGRAEGVAQRPRLLARNGIGAHPSSSKPWPPLIRPVVIAILVVAVAATALLVGSRILRSTVAPLPVIRGESSVAVPTFGALPVVGQPWVEVDGPAQAGSGQQSAVLPGGKVLLVGGVTESGLAAAAELFDPKTGAFTATGTPATTHDLSTMTTLRDGRVLVAGGGFETAQASAELYDPVTGAFSETGSLRQARGWCHCGVNFVVLVRPAATALIDGGVLVVGGRVDGPQGTVTDPPGDLYDPVTGTFSQTPSIPCDASRGALATLRDGRVLVVCVNGAALYDPATDTFAPTEPRSAANTASAVVLADGRVLVTGPVTRGSGDHAEIFDPATGDFRVLDAPFDPPGEGVLLPDGRVLFGTDTTAWAGQPTSHTIAIFDPSTEAFMTADTPWPWVGRTVTVLPDGRVLFTGGWSSDGRTLPSVILDPASAAFHD